MSHNALLRISGAMAIAAIWCITLILPAYAQKFDTVTVRVLMGYQVLQGGWMAILYGQIAWLANPVLALLLVSLTSRSFSDRTSQIAALAMVAATATMIDLVLRPVFNQHPHVLVGGWLWLANNLAAAVFAFVVTRKSVSIKQ